MTTLPLFPGFDGLMTLSRREGVDIRPTLLRVLTDLYVQASTHTADEERQFVELTSRLIDQVDDATRAAVRARLAIYPDTPARDPAQARAEPARPDASIPLAREIPAGLAAPARRRRATGRATQQWRPNLVDAAERRRRNQRHVFPRRRQRTRADPAQSASARRCGPRRQSPPRAPPAPSRSLEMAAFAADVENFTLELGEA